MPLISEEWADNPIRSIRNRRKERERAFLQRITPYLLRTAIGTIILGGDFNCIFDPMDKTGHFQTSRTLADLIHGMELQDTRKQNPAKLPFTHHSPASATRIDPLYISRSDGKKQGTEIIQHPLRITTQ